MTKLNKVDREQIARTQAEKLRTRAIAEALELEPSLVGLLEGIGKALINLHSSNERALEVQGRLIQSLDRLELTERGMVDELAALRTQRAAGHMNGHAKDDTLDTEGT